jgi:transposase-like protein
MACLGLSHANVEATQEGAILHLTKYAPMDRFEAAGDFALATAPFNDPRFNDESAAFAYVEAALWPEGPVCPHCGNCDPRRIRKMAGKATRMGLYNCNECKGQFTVRQGTIFEKSHLPLRFWLQVIHLMCASKKGISTNQIQRMLSCSMKTAWFLTHRIREAMRDGSLAPMGGAGGIVEIDETYIGKRTGFTKVMSGSKHKNTVLTLIERGGKSRSFHIDRATKAEIVPIVKANIDREARIMTDEAGQYVHIGREFASHQSVDHCRDEYSYYDKKSDTTVSTNTVEGYYSIFKRGMKGVFQHCGEQHLHRYLAEFDFRYSNRAKLGVNDKGRAERALLGVKGKRLTYETAMQG